MKHFFRGGEGMSCGESDRVNELTSYHVLSSCPKEQNYDFRLLRPLGRSRSDGGGESLRATFGLASPLLRPYNTDLPRIHHRFTTFASGVLGQTVVKRWSKYGQTPKLVRSRYGSDQEEGSYEAPDLTPTMYQLSSAQVLPWFCFCSTSLRIPHECSMNRLRSFIGAPTQPLRSGIEAPSEKGRTRSGLGRYQVGTSLVCLSPSARDFTAPEAKDRQTIGKEQATDKQRITEEQAKKYQAKPKPSPKKEQRNSKETSIKLYSKDPLAVVAGSFGRASGQRRTCMQVCSTAIRQLFESGSVVRRSAVEAESNTTRRSLEAVPNQSRSGVEGKSKSSRRLVEEESKTARSGCENATFQKGAQTNVELALTQPITKVELGMNYQTTKDELATNLERTNVELAKEVHERYCKGTKEWG